jgi:nitrous oxide reductase accessory protein NosL
MVAGSGTSDVGQVCLDDLAVRPTWISVFANVKAYSRQPEESQHLGVLYVVSGRYEEKPTRVIPNSK